MEASERDSTEEWLLPEDSRPPLLGELEARIDEALVTARASEAAVMTVGAAALDAAEQAKRAAELAERASAAMLTSGERDDGGAPAAASRQSDRVARSAARGHMSEDPLPGDGPDGDSGLNEFSARADRLAARLRELERPSAASVG